MSTQLNLLASLALIFCLTIFPVGVALAADNPSDFAVIDAYIETQMRDLRIPGLALGIVQGEQLVHLKGFGLWRRWQREPSRQPQGWRRGWAIAGPLLPPLLWALLLFVLVPQITYPVAVLRINAPDLGYTLLVSGTLAVLWCILWIGLNGFGARGRTVSTNAPDRT
jgi:hypothetical protein